METAATAAAAAASADSRHRKRQDKKACTGCRQQKLKCDAFDLEYSKPCSRCQKLQLECKIEGSFKRTHKRLKLAEMEQRVEVLKRRLGSAGATTPTDVGYSPISVPDSLLTLSSPSSSSSNSAAAAAAVASGGAAGGRGGGGGGGGELDGGNNGGAGQAKGAAATAGDQQLLEMPPNLYESSGTVPRTAEGVNLDATQIDELFSLYFTHYHPLMPVLDPTASPNAYYTQSHLLFWTILGVGSRRYYKDPTLMGVLGPRLVNRALTSIPFFPWRVSPVQYIQSLLMLCTWPFPKNTVSKDSSYTLSGLLIQLSMQIGLHLPVLTQDFIRVRVTLSEHDIRKRAELWAYCVLISQRTGCAFGLPLMTHLDSYDIGAQTPLSGVFSYDLYLQKRLQKLYTNCATAVAQSVSCRKSTLAQEHSRNVLIKVFVEQLRSLEIEVRQLKASLLLGYNALYVSITKLLIRQFHLYNELEPPDLADVAELYAATLSTVQNAVAIPGLYFSCSCYIFNMLILAAFTMLKLLKSSFAKYVDGEAGKTALFSLIALIRKTSIENNDLPARSAGILTQLWTSDKIFRDPNTGDWKDDLKLRLRSRAAMSIVYDCIWWWKLEFAAPNGLAAAAAGVAKAPPGSPAGLTPKQSQPGGDSAAKAAAAASATAAQAQAHAAQAHAAQAQVTGPGLIEHVTVPMVNAAAHEMSHPEAPRPNDLAAPGQAVSTASDEEFTTSFLDTQFLDDLDWMTSLEFAYNFEAPVYQ